MAQDFAQHFVDLSRRGLAPHALSELRLNHVEGRFDIGVALVVEVRT